MRVIHSTPTAMVMKKLVRNLLF